MFDHRGRATALWRALGISACTIRVCTWARPAVRLHPPLALRLVVTNHNCMAKQHCRAHDKSDGFGRPVCWSLLLLCFTCSSVTIYISYKRTAAKHASAYHLTRKYTRKTEAAAAAVMRSVLPVSRSGKRLSVDCRRKRYRQVVPSQPVSRSHGLCTSYVHILHTRYTVVANVV